MRKTLGIASLLFWLVACSGGSGGGLFGGGNPTFPPCDPGTQVQLANPLPGQTGVNPAIGQIEIVANGNTDTLYTTYQQWSLTLYDGSGNVYPGNGLNLVSDPGGPHPYASDFYYASSVSGLISGRTYTVRLGWVGQNCNEVAVGSFST